MSATTAASILPIVERRGLSMSEVSLATLLRTKASWIWTEETVDKPGAPDNVQRAFRKTFPFPSDKSKPANVTLMVAADDYFAMYINGVLAHAEDITHDYKNILAFNVPIPTVKEDQPSSMVLGFRVVNKSHNAGLLVAAQVNYEGGQTDVFFTGLDQTWLGETLFEEHWEQPWFDSTVQASNWRPAIVYTSEELPATIPQLVRQEIVVMGAISASSGNIPQLGSAPTPSNEACVGPRCPGADGGIGLSKGGFAGALVGSVVLAFLLGALASFLLTKRKYRALPTDDASAFWGVTPPQFSEVQPTTKPGRHIHAAQGLRQQHQGAEELSIHHVSNSAERPSTRH